MKTIKKWFNELPEDVREKALRNADAGNVDLEVENLKVALATAFQWYTPPEGFVYWEQIYLSS